MIEKLTVCVCILSESKSHVAKCSNNSFVCKENNGRIWYNSQLMGSHAPIESSGSFLLPYGQ
uniref:Uncharacterized protein n=1 Tax=Amphimedon queenslandica TaxID=400682 RepID=A0A1X7VFZ4_AMPQE